MRTQNSPKAPPYGGAPFASEDATSPGRSTVRIWDGNDPPLTKVQVPPPDGTKIQGEAGASIPDREDRQRTSQRRVLASSVPPVSSFHDYYASHLALFDEMDRAYAEQGRLDPETWIALGTQIDGLFEGDLLSLGQYLQLHSIVENRLKGTWGGFG